ncbi:MULTISPECIES: DUF559 domain-containing protein [Thermoactinomyces]|uniref:DUF559 domain-containing protein n=1 Tax=Thermoactinomyces vulgaris TaxID=2026 RepID=A0ABS0QHG3_THEVU|nr:MULTISPECIES: DUF559 domain-containing protein [Thermoactinomyces]KYQ86588.1 hypothetical protein AYX07_05410 [Thermoactinomyces sp. AS95]MBA4550892.1 DUF559 domain-containing protein [Thermoactinomyces vulgaris]MBA4596049.1 DUF559 domain-containing protein [Thermoactinomyces vulgaris]MBH8588668.1 DUF559 domain-containing protein [Thermoactinomyces vulgaris]MBI0386493.1 DUF559 domain-containing protein [Thermoactinomyces sp. CICC 24227]
MLPLFNNRTDRCCQLSWKFRKLRRKWRHHWLWIPFFIPVWIYEQVRLGFFPFIHFQLLHTCNPWERKLYYALYSKFGRDVKIRYPIHRHRVAIAIPKYKLALECDGDTVIRPKKQLRFQTKKHDLGKQGWKVMRFSRRRLSGEMDQVIREITEYTNIMKKRKSPGQFT